MDNLFALCYCFECGPSSLATEGPAFPGEDPRRSAVSQRAQTAFSLLCGHSHTLCLYTEPGHWALHTAISSTTLNTTQPPTLTINSAGVMKNQHILHHSQNKRLFFPSIISMSSMNLFPPVEGNRREHCKAGASPAGVGTQVDARNAIVQGSPQFCGKHSSFSAG